MPREMRILFTLTLPDDEFEAAEILVRHKPAIAALREALGPSVVVTTETGAAQAPRQRRPRKPRVVAGTDQDAA
jgi:hypothetical protein